MKKKDKPSLEELKKFWDGPKAGFNEDLHKKYLDAKKRYKIKMN